jgi:hypothetical protein
MGVWHVENPHFRSIYQPLLAAVPVLSLAGGDFVVEQVRRVVEKKPTALPQWVFCFLNLS